MQADYKIRELLGKMNRFGDEQKQIWATNFLSELSADYIVLENNDRATEFLSGLAQQAYSNDTVTILQIKHN